MNECHNLIQQTFNWIVVVSVAQYVFSSSACRRSLILSRYVYGVFVTKFSTCSTSLDSDMNTYKIKIFEIHNDLLIIRKILEWLECVCVWLLLFLLSFIALQHFDAKFILHSMPMACFATEAAITIEFEFIAIAIAIAIFLCRCLSYFKRNRFTIVWMQCMV